MFDLRPLPAFMILNLSGIASTILFLLIYTILGLPPSVVGLVIVYFGWVALFTRRYQALAGNSANSKTILIPYLATILAHAVLIPIVSSTRFELAGPEDYFVVVLTASIGICAPLYLLYIASKTLVFAESHSKEPLNRMVGTFIAFFYLPIGVYFLQSRILALRSY